MSGGYSDAGKTESGERATPCNGAECFAFCLENLGTVRKVGNYTSNISVPFDNRGTGSVEQGTLEIRAASSHTDVSWSVASGATLHFSSNTHTFVGTPAGTIAGTLLSDA
ncbi:MAG: hypothetical protein ACK4UU_01140, partial [Fimbriimonadales bacterium]